MSKPAAFALALVVAGSARAASDAPQAVRDAVKKAHPNATVKSWKQERQDGAWSAALEEGGAKLRVDTDATGKVVAEERQATEADLPDAVRKSLEQSKYKGWKVVRVEKVTAPERADDASWELSLKKGKRMQGVRFEQDGRMAAHEALKTTTGNEEKARREVEHEPQAK